MSRYTNIVYIGRYLVLTYKARFISTVCCFFSNICWSVNCMSWTFDFRDVQKLKHEFIFESFYYCYLSKVQFVLFVPIQTFFWSANCTILLCKLCILFQAILDLWPVLILDILGSWDIKKGQFQFSVTFLAVFFWCVNCTSGL